ncbi:MAG: polyphenol oxidase family protein [Nocardioidaceae bacterium]
MFAATATRTGAAGVVDVAFTDRFADNSPATTSRLLDLAEPFDPNEPDERSCWSKLTQALEVGQVADMHQVHGRDVCVVENPAMSPPVCDALVTSATDVALCVRVADCVPVVMAAVDYGLVAVVHAGRRGVVSGAVHATLDVMRGLGAEGVEAWIGPHVCGGCYEVPACMRSEVAAVVPTAYACTTWGTPSVDLGAAVRQQLESWAVVVNDVSRCTQESPDLFSYRRDGNSSGRAGGLVVRRGGTGV